MFGKDVGGNEFAQLYRYDVADGRITLLTDGGRSQNGGAAWSTKGDRLAYGSTRRNGADRDLYVMNPADPKTDKLVMQVTGGGWQAHRLVAGRQPAARHGVRVDYQEHAVGGRCGERPEDGAHQSGGGGRPTGPARSRPTAAACT